MEVLNSLLGNVYFILIFYIIFFVGIIIVMSNFFRFKKLEKKYNNFINKFANKDIESTLKDYFNIVNQVNEENKIILAEIKNIDKRIDGCIQKIGIVKYNAFDDVGNNLSFAISLLDNNNNGIILNGIYGRNSSNMYAKSVYNGKSEYPLSDEEEDALKKAINSK